MRCLKCGTENPVAKKFCRKCGAALGGRCLKCGAENPADSTFCGDCGTALGVPAEAASTKKSDDRQIRVADLPAPEKLEGERKTVTALFADIKGSTELEQDLDPEEARAIVDPALKLMIDAVRHYDGYVVQSTGDGIFAIFGAPLAHEDHAQRALYAALRMQEDLRRYAATLRERGRAPIEIRVGVNTGEVVVRAIQTAAGHAEYTPIGHAANLASRMQTVAATGTIATTEETRKLCEGYFTFRALGPTRVKGVSEPVNVHEVTGLGALRTRLQASARRGLSKFVGRQAELEQMKRALESAKSGHGQIVAAVGEAGLGKSRLFFEFQAIEQSGSLVLETSSVSHGKASAYLPLIDLLKNYFEINADDDVRKRREKIGGKILILDRALEDTLPFIFALLEVAPTDDPVAQMESQLKRRRTLDAIRRLILRESLNQPIVVVFEDLHWVDEGTQVLLNILAESIGTARVLMLLNYRPEYTHTWGNKTYYTQLRLDPLGKESAEEMLSALLGDGRELAALKRVIVEKTEGNPFYMEEIVQSLFERGALIRNGAVKLAKSMSSIQLPTTVQAVIASRIDRLPPEEKDLLNTLAVIGKEFSLELVRQIVGKSDDDLQAMLTHLQAAEFIYEQSAITDTAYVFKHALSQQVAYGSALNERRKVLHERIARALEANFAETVETRPELIAHHYSEAGLSVEAIPYWQRAGERALERYANAEAMSHLTRAIDLLKSMPNSTERGVEPQVDESAHCSISLLQSVAQVNLGEHLAAQETILHAADMARELGSTDLLAQAALFLARMSAEFGVPAAPAVRLLEDASAALGADDRPQKVKVLAGLARALSAAGVLQRATEHAKEAIAMARRLGDPYLLGEGLVGGLFAFQGPEHAEQRLAYGIEMRRLIEGSKIRQLSSYHIAEGYTGWSLVYSFLEIGDMPAFDKQIDTLERSLEKGQEPFGLSLAAGFRAVRAMMHGRFAESEAFAEQANEIGKQLQTDNASGVFALQMFTLRREQGRMKELEPVVRFFVQQNSADAAWRPGLAVVYSDLGLVKEARDQFEQLAHHSFTDIPRDGLWMASMTYLADVCTFLGDRRRAEKLYELLLPFAKLNVVVGNASACYGALSRYLGALAATLERWSDAEQHFEHAIAMNSRMDAKPWLAHTQDQFALMLLARNRSGDRDKAAELLNAALAIAREIGMLALQERVAAKIQQLRPELH